ncbi:hypothetical protein NN561_020151 [Cricetulus griseus]
MPAPGHYRPTVPCRKGRSTAPDPQCLWPSGGAPASDSCTPQDHSISTPFRGQPIVVHRNPFSGKILRSPKRREIRGEPSDLFPEVPPKLPGRRASWST